MLDAVRSGRPRTFVKIFERVRRAFSCSAMGPIRSAARELKLPHTTIGGQVSAKR